MNIEKPLLTLAEKYNNTLPKNKQFPSLDFINECVLYDDTNGQIIWLERPEHHFKNKAACKRFNTINKTKSIYFIEKNRYMVTLNDVSYHAADIVWYMKTKTPPIYDVGFIDKNTLNYRYENLQYITQHNKTGYIGVYFNNNKFYAQIWIDGKNLSLGYFDTAEEAHQRYCDAIDHKRRFGNLEKFN